MKTRVEWRCSVPFSVLHAAGTIARHGSVTDPQIEVMLASFVAAINQRLILAELNLDSFWTRLLATNPDSEEDRERCEAALLAAGCSPLAIDGLATAIVGMLTRIRDEYGKRFPKLAEQLPLRGKPIRQQWDERGRGLLQQIESQIQMSFLPARVLSYLIQPVRGGDGGVQAECGTLWIEAVLTNMHSAIPEILRVGWLIARLGMAQGVARQLVDADRLKPVSALAMVPIVLAAGQTLELVPDGPLPIKEALQTWKIDSTDDTDNILSQWWQQFAGADLPFPVAVKALSRMCGPQL